MPVSTRVPRRDGGETSEREFISTRKTDVREWWHELDARAVTRPADVAGQ